MKLEENPKLQSNNQSDEIDLTKVFTKIYGSISFLFKNIFKIFFSIADSILSNIKLITALCALGGVLGCAYFFIAKPYYESHMTLGSNYFKGELLNNTIENLNEVCKERNTYVLARLLNIPHSKAKSLKSVAVEPLLSQNFKLLFDLYSKDDKYQGKLDSLLIYTDQSTFRMKVEIYDTASLKGLDTILINYVKNNDYVKKRIKVDRENLANMQKKLNKESGSLDTLKRSIAASLRSSGDAGRSGTNNVILGEKSVNPIDIYREDLIIYNQKQEVERELALNAEIEIIERFIPYAEPKSGTLIKNIVKGVLLGFIFAFLIVLFKMFRSGLNRLRYNLESN